MAKSKSMNGSWVRVVMLIVVGLSCLVVAVVSMARHGPTALTLFFLAMGGIPIAAATSILYWRRRIYGDGPTTDEREHWLRLRADSAGNMSFMLYCGLICIVPSFVLRSLGDKTVTLGLFWIPMIFVYGLILRTAVRTFVLQHIRRQELTNDHE